MRIFFILGCFFLFANAQLVEVEKIGVINLSTYEKKELFPALLINEMYYHEDELKLVVKVGAVYQMFCNVLVGTVFNWSSSPQHDLYYYEHIEGKFGCKP